ncbi:hypothetical protein Poli38472_005179 [Pythium oligandrum]|uniref:Uncharacterized protein n=1 Tax=Pythium oligandrum TaxID=41045 RepID=A0A8K1CGV3_PYTOL|nr:hypothetical protein Poli38472_005179 [Pythium oligandrum]|eukprot:TMW62561.1 hypothetical protein Poli38472_005179 [Pythium oligandrum]
MESSRPQREILLGAAAGLLCLGLAPFFIQPGTFQFMAHGFDESIMTLGLTFAGLSLATGTLSSIDLPRTVLRWSLLVLSSAFLLAVSISCFRVYSELTTPDLASLVSKGDAATNGELVLEGRVNHLFCIESLRNVCQHHTIAQAKTVYTSVHWPPSSDNVVVKEACARGYDPLDTKSQSEGCRMCQQPPFKDGSDLDVVVKRIKLSRTAMQWCGAYNRAQRPLLDAPYRQHRAEIRRNLEVQAAKREASMCLTLVFIVFSLPAIVAMIWWLCSVPYGASIKSL